MCIIMSTPIVAISLSVELSEAFLRIFNNDEYVLIKPSLSVELSEAFLWIFNNDEYVLIHHYP